MIIISDDMLYFWWHVVFTQF